MDTLLTALRACAEPTRLRLLALTAQSAYCVVELTDILGQSQPRLSRHLRLLCDAGLLERAREGSNVWFSLPAGPPGDLVRMLLREVPENDPLLQADRRQAARVLAERARVASDNFHRQGADWDEMRALGLPAADVEAALLRLLPSGNLGRLLDIGTGTGRLLEILAPRVSAALGIDASRSMLALARERLARQGLFHCTVRLADMYRLPLPENSFDLCVMQMVLHYAESPADVLAEAARMLRPGGRLVVIDLAAHHTPEITARLAHRWPGFSDADLQPLLEGAGFTAADSLTVDAAMPIRLWCAPLANQNTAELAA
jgi:ArsR family transcriptional regulator